MGIPDAVAGRSLAEQHQVVAGLEPALELIALSGRSPPASIDEHRALQFGEMAEERPARHFSLGDEAGRQKLAENDDIEPRNVVADKQHRPTLGQRPQSDNRQSQ